MKRAARPAELRNAERKRSHTDLRLRARLPEIRTWVADGWSKKAVCMMLNCGVVTLDRLLKAEGIDQAKHPHGVAQVGKRPFVRHPSVIPASRERDAGLLLAAVRRELEPKIRTMDQFSRMELAELQAKVEAWHRER